jgi:hypothetical protein
MSWLTGITAALLGHVAKLLPAGRREWAEALGAEAHEVPAGWRRLSWLAGGVWMAVAGTAGRAACVLAFGAAAAGTAWSAWPGPPGDPATPVNRVDVIAVTVILAGLPWAGRRVFGSAGAGRPAQVVRAGGYAAVLALALVKASVERLAYAPPNTLGSPRVFYVGEAVFLVVIAWYAAWILAATTRPTAPAIAPAVLAGAAAALVADALGPLGLPLGFTGTGPAGLYDALLALGTVLVLAAPAAAGLHAARRAIRDRQQNPYWTPVQQGALAGLTTGITAALLVTVLGTATIALLPHDPGLLQWAMMHLGQFARANLGHATPREYAAENSVYAWGYLIVLVGGPLLGGMLGACGGCCVVARLPATPSR